MNEKAFIGGQAVIEGVMMRGPRHTAIAVRNPAGEISVCREPLVPWASRWPVLKWPLVRGVAALGESLVLGVKSLSYSAQMAGEEEEQLSSREIAMTLLFSIAVAVLLFVVVPTYAAKFMAVMFPSATALNLAEGLLRLAIFLGYVAAISGMKDIQRVFQYHGAEHKTIHAYEAGVPLDPAHVRPYSTLHPRCGTNFLLIVMLVSILVFSFLGWPSLLWRILSRVVLLPVVAGVAYEVIRFAGRSDKQWVHVAILPGLWLQKLTTREPDDSQIEVAIQALQAVRPQAAGEDEVMSSAGEVAGAGR